MEFTACKQACKSELKIMSFVMCFHIYIPAITSPFLHDRPFQQSQHNSEAVLWIIFLSIYKSSWLLTVSGQLPHNAFWSLAAWCFGLSHALNEGWGVMKHLELQNNPEGFVQPDVSRLTAQVLNIWKTDEGTYCCILILRILWLKNNTTLNICAASCAAVGSNCSDGSSCRWF